MATPCSLIRTSRHASKLSPISRARGAPLSLYHSPSRALATVHSGPRVLPDVWFSAATAHLSIQPTSNGESGKPDERTLKLGKTLRILQERMPNLLQSPLPQEILSPQISLHLFPSTHPHLPTVSGRVAYSAALWTSPLAWGRVPIVGNVKLIILSERMIKPTSSSHTEQLVVRWKTVGKTKGKGTGAFYKGIGGSERVDKITEFLGGGKGENDSKEFTGLFIFEFDGEGRVASHTIEHVQEGGNWEKGVGAKVVGLTDWLLGGMKQRGEHGGACPAFYAEESKNEKLSRK